MNNLHAPVLTLTLVDADDSAPTAFYDLLPDGTWVNVRTGVTPPPDVQLTLNQIVHAAVTDYPEDHPQHVIDMFTPRVKTSRALDPSYIVTAALGFITQHTGLFALAVIVLMAYAAANW